MNHKEMIERLRQQSCTGDCDGGLISDAADELERLRKIIGNVIAGDWCLTDLQESIRDLE